MDGDESGNEEEKPAFRGGKVGTQGSDTRQMISWMLVKNEPILLGTFAGINKYMSD